MKNRLYCFGCGEPLPLDLFGDFCDECDNDDSDDFADEVPR